MGNLQLCCKNSELLKEVESYEAVSLERLIYKNDKSCKCEVLSGAVLHWYMTNKLIEEVWIVNELLIIFQTHRKGQQQYLQTW